MDYTKHYTLLIERARTRRLECYTEKHHILPRCVGGDNSPENLVELTAEEHYVAHQLLVKMYPQESKLVYALLAMSNLDRGPRMNNRLYGWIKRKLSIAASERRKDKTYEELYGNELAAEVKKKSSKRMKGNTLSLGRVPWNKGLTKKDTARLRSIGWHKGQEFTDEHKLKLSTAKKNKSYEEIYGVEGAARKKMAQQKALQGRARPEAKKWLSKPVLIDNIRYESRQEAADSLGLHRTTIEKWINKGKAETLHE